MSAAHEISENVAYPDAEAPEIPDDRESDLDAFIASAKLRDSIQAGWYVAPRAHADGIWWRILVHPYPERIAVTGAGGFRWPGEGPPPDQLWGIARLSVCFQFLMTPERFAIEYRGYRHIPNRQRSMNELLSGLGCRELES